MKHCKDCDRPWGHCNCMDCADCGELADALCQECESPFCAEHLQARPGFTHLRWCAPCLEAIAAYVPCASEAPGRRCVGLTFAAERLHDCADCGKAFCARCIVVTPLSDTEFSAVYHCPSCYAQRKAA